MAASQAPNFAVTLSNCFGGSEEEDYFAGSVGLDGSFLMSGFSNSIDGDIDSSLAYDTTNIFVVKCDPSGNKIWAKTFGGNDYDKARYIMQDADSNYLVVGVTHSSDGDIDTTHGDSELFVLKLDKDGNKIWMKMYGGTGYEGGRYIQQLPSGDYLVTGYSTSHNYDVPVNRGQHDAWLFKIDVNGNLIWSQTYGGSGDDRPRVSLPTPDGGYVFLGSSTSNDFQVSGNHGVEDFWIGKVDSVGNLEWNYSYGGTGEDWPYGMTATADGGFLLTGTTDSNDGDVTGYMGWTDGWVVKIDASGIMQWQKCYGGSLVDRLYRTFENSDGTLTTFGFSQSTDFDLTASNTGPSNNYWLARLDSVNNVAWSYCVGGAWGDFGIDLVIDTLNQSYTMMGESASSNGPVLNAHGNFDFWIVRVEIFTALPEIIPPGFTWNAFYDNSTDAFIIQSGSGQKVHLEIMDVTGHLVYSDDMQVRAGENRVPLNLAGGTYFARFRDNKKSEVIRFALLK